MNAPINCGAGVLNIDASADPIDVHIGQRVRLIRRGREVSQVALGEQLGVSFQQVQKYERGTNRISGSMMVRACRFLRCTLNDLTEGLPLTALAEAEESLADRHVRQLANTSEGRELLLAFDTAGEVGRRLMLQVASAFLERGH